MGWRNGKYLLGVLVLAGVFYFLFLVQGVLVPFLLGAIIAYALNPAVNFVHQQGTTRIAAISVVYGILLFLLVVVGIFIIPSLIKELERLAVSVPEFAELIIESMENLSERYRRFALPASIRQIIDESINRMEGTIIDWVRRLSQSFLNLFSQLLSVILAPILSFYMLKDKQLIIGEFVKLVPHDKKSDIQSFFSEIDHVLGGFIRGQLLVSLIVGILTGTALYLLGLRFAVLIGFLAGLLNLIPYFGPILAAVPAVSLSFLQSPLIALYVLIIIVVIQQVESSILAPNILGESVGLHPLIIIFSLLAGGRLFGFLGLLFGIPAAGIIKVIIRKIIINFLHGTAEKS